VRRIILSAAAALFGLAATTAWAGTVSHGLSAFGDLKYDADFMHFDYVNQEAPKGGTFSTLSRQAKTSFDSINPFIMEGEAP